MSVQFISPAGALQFTNMAKLADQMKKEEINVGEKWSDAVEYGQYEDEFSQFKIKGAKWGTIFNIDEVRKLVEFDKDFAVKAFIIAQLYELFQSKRPLLKIPTCGPDELNKLAVEVMGSCRSPDTIVTYKSSLIVIDSAILSFKFTRMRNDVGQLMYRGVVLCTHKQGWEKADYEALRLTANPWVNDK